VIHNHHIGWDLKYERKARNLTTPTITYTEESNGGRPERIPIIRELEHLKQFEEIEKRIHALMRNMLYGRISAPGRTARRARS
jgi:hypothetical protein